MSETASITLFALRLYIIASPLLVQCLDLNRNLLTYVQFLNSGNLVPRPQVFIGNFAMLTTRVYPTAGNLADMVGTFTTGEGCTISALESWQMKDVYAADVNR